MRYRDTDLRGIPAVTENGQKIGKLTGFVMDNVTHAVVQYVVSRSRLLSALLPDELLINYSQVVSLDDEKLVVKGEVVAVEEASQPAVAEGPAGMTPMTRE